MNVNHELTEKIEAEYAQNRKSFVSRARRSVRNAADAEDVLQDVFVRILENANVLDVVTNVPALIWKGIKNRVIDVWRHNVVRRESGETDVAEETIEEIVSSIGFDPLDLAIRNELSDAFEAALEGLSHEQQAVIEAQVIDGMTFAELSERTGLSINTLMTRKRMAVKKLAHALRDWIEEE
jgi:RNA polymerase sigma factor (sigma-70 family)